MYQIINRQTKAIKGTAKTRKAAINKRDKLDNIHGSYVHFINEIK